MADEKKDINWNYVIIAILLLIISSFLTVCRRMFMAIPMGSLVASVASMASCITATLLFENALHLNILPSLNPLDWF